MHTLETSACTPTARSQTVVREPDKGSTEEAPRGHSGLTQGAQGGRGQLRGAAETGWCEDEEVSIALSLAPRGPWGLRESGGLTRWSRSTPSSG